MHAHTCAVLTVLSSWLQVVFSKTSKQLMGLGPSFPLGPAKLCVHRVRFVCAEPQAPGNCIVSLLCHSKEFLFI